MRSAVVALAVLALLGGAPTISSSPAAPGLSFPRGRAVVGTRDGRRIAVSVEIARTAEQRAVGLMGRTSLARDAGMLFLFTQPTRGPFWMRGTRIALAIAFLDAPGRIVRIMRMEPCRADPCRLYEPGVAYRSASKGAAGSFGRWRVRRGDVVRLVRR